MTTYDDIIQERLEKLKVLYSRKLDLEECMQEKEEELRYFQNKKEMKAVSLSACKLTGLE